jgi:hypothetical protein
VIEAVNGGVVAAWTSMCVEAACYDVDDLVPVIRGGPASVPAVGRSSATGSPAVRPGRIWMRVPLRCARCICGVLKGRRPSPLVHAARKLLAQDLAPAMLGPACLPHTPAHVM